MLPFSYDFYHFLTLTFLFFHFVVSVTINGFAIFHLTEIFVSISRNRTAVDLGMPGFLVFTCCPAASHFSYLTSSSVLKAFVLFSYSTAITSSSCTFSRAGFVKLLSLCLSVHVE